MLVVNSKPWYCLRYRDANKYMRGREAVIAFSESGGVHTGAGARGWIKGGCDVGCGVAASWVGNNTQKRRVFLHLVFVPYWMVLVRVTTEGLEFGNIDYRVQQTLRSVDGVDVDFISRLHGKIGCSKHASSISKEYNDGHDVHDPCGANDFVGTLRCEWSIARRMDI